jgi:hypothetical protein
MEVKIADEVVDASDMDIDEEDIMRVAMVCDDFPPEVFLRRRVYNQLREFRLLVGGDRLVNVGWLKMFLIGEVMRMSDDKMKGRGVECVDIFVDYQRRVVVPVATPELRADVWLVGRELMAFNRDQRGYKVSRLLSKLTVGMLEYLSVGLAQMVRGVMDGRVDDVLAVVRGVYMRWGRC